MFGEGKYHIIPSFYRALIFLKKQRRDFQIVLRSFEQSYADKIKWEFNRFCSGQHPCFSGRNGAPLILFDGSKGTKDMRIQSVEQQASFYRLSNELTDANLLVGSYERGEFEKLR